MDLRRLAPVDHRYGTLEYYDWRVTCGAINGILLEFRSDFTDTEIIIVYWWRASDPSIYRRLSTRGTSSARLCGELAVLLGDIAQATAVSLCIEGDVRDPLV
jgi:hypothetical protein